MFAVVHGSTNHETDNVTKICHSNCIACKAQASQAYQSTSPFAPGRVGVSGVASGGPALYSSTYHHLPFLLMLLPRPPTNPPPANPSSIPPTPSAPAMAMAAAATLAASSSAVSLDQAATAALAPPRRLRIPAAHRGAMRLRGSARDVRGAPAAPQAPRRSCWPIREISGAVQLPGSKSLSTGSSSSPPSPR
ncbi:hypothetical protein ZWY2020_041347 [Hordeum vulgare]|nr:hypothetical protein ZWY2020_041347 [Hordeum vulgare]